MKRVVVIVNKWWECQPVLCVLLNRSGTPAGFPWPSTLLPSRPYPTTPQPPDPSPRPRAVFTFSAMAAEIWCISDLLIQFDGPGQSSSENKAHQLPQIKAYGNAPDLVISVGTASSSDASVTKNGCVAIGTKVFMHDGHPGGGNPKSQWTGGPFDTIVGSSVPAATFQAIFAADSSPVALGFIPAPLNPAPAQNISASFQATALCTINVTDPTEYAAKDLLTVQAFAALPSSPAVAASVDTTHGVVRATVGSSFLFISAIVNRLGRYGQEVAPRSFAQNTAGASNAGVLLAWLLMRLNQVL